MYDVILADPPWPYWGSATKDAAAGKHYELMSLADILAMPVQALAKTDAACFIWATGPLLPFAIKTMAAWGFHYRGVAWVWIKTRADGKIIHGQGVRPTFVKPNAEFVLAGSSGKTGRPLPLMDEAVPQVVLARRGQHSAKPEVFQDHIESLFGPADRLELFARRHRPGWDCTGIELCGTDYRTGRLLP